MMPSTNVFLLVKAYLQGTPLLRQLGFKRFKTTKKRRFGKLTPILMAILIGILILNVMLVIVLNLREIERVGLLLGQKGLGMAVGFLSAVLLTFLYGFYLAGTVLYRGNDLRFLIPLPITTRELFFSRVIIHYLQTIPIYLLFTLSIFISHALVHSVSLHFIVAAVITLLVGPVFPLALALILARLLSVGTPSGRRYRVGEIITFVLLFVLMFLMQGLSTRLFSDNLSAGFGSNIAQIVTKGEQVLRYFLWQSQLFFSPGASRALFSYLLFSLLLGLFSLYIASRNYTQVLSLSFIGSTRGKSAPKQQAVQRSATPLRALLGKEFAILHGHGAFKMELYGEALVPIILIVVYFISGTLDEISSLIQSVTLADYFPLMYVLVLSTMSNLSMMSSTSISREGKLFEMTKTWPIAGQTHLLAKVIAHIILFGSSYVLFASAGFFLFPLAKYHLVWILLLGLVSIVQHSLIGLAIDYRRPLLDWELPTQAVKQNLNGLYGMLAALVLQATYTLIGMFFYRVVGLGTLSIAFLLLLISVALLPLWYHIALTGAQVQYQN